MGAVTCFYVPTEEKTFTDRLQNIGMMSDFYAGILVAWQLDGIKFALGPTIATTRTRLAGFGGYAAIENRPADDLLVGRLIAEQGYEVVLLPYTIETVADYGSFARAAAQAAALDRGDAESAAVGALRVDLHAGIGVDAGRGGFASDGCSGGGIFRRVPGAAGGDDGADCRLGAEAGGVLEEHVDDSAVGCGGLRHLAGEFFAQQHSLARGGLLHPRRATGSGFYTLAGQQHDAAPALPKSRRLCVRQRFPSGPISQGWFRR